MNPNEIILPNPTPSLHPRHAREFARDARAPARVHEQCGHRFEEEGADDEGDRRFREDEFPRREQRRDCARTAVPDNLFARVEASPRFLVRAFFLRVNLVVGVRVVTRGVVRLVLINS